MEIHTHNDQSCVVLQTFGEFSALKLAAESLEPAIETRFPTETKKELMELSSQIDYDSLHISSEKFEVIRAAARYALFSCHVGIRSRIASACPSTRAGLELLHQTVIE
jgi:hypothetical protein